MAIRRARKPGCGLTMESLVWDTVYIYPARHRQLTAYFEQAIESIRYLPLAVLFGVQSLSTILTILFLTSDSITVGEPS